ncbi:MAG: hypothetical protein FWE04_08480 [Oscillospiraceae bacterium]|nr:hypothetical protein [Oscillospiraceae bacterium]
MKLKFFGDVYAELFTKQLNESLAGGLRENYVSEDEPGFPKGFLRASRKHFTWWDACWTRDAGSFIRELSFRGYIDEAANCANYLIDHVEKNAAGFYSFPRYFNRENLRGSGEEQDGTANVVMGLIELYNRLESGENKAKIHAFLTSESSPVRCVLNQLKNSPLIPGSGEFGGGWGVEGLFYNVNQNFLILSMLRLYNKYISQEKEVEDAISELYGNIKKHFIKNGKFVWCLDMNFCEYDVSYKPNANGTSSINGIAGAIYDGLFDGAPEFADEIKNTVFDLIHGEDLRKYLYETYGMLTHTKKFPADHPEEYIGHVSWLAYCECYLGETAILIRDIDMLTKAVRYIVGQTAYGGHMPQSYTEQELRAQTNFYFSERNFSPEWEGIRNEGCGSLNLINIAQPLHLSRVMTGLNGTLDIKPNLPRGFDGFEAIGYSVIENGILQTYDVRYEVGGLLEMNKVS